MRGIDIFTFDETPQTNGNGIHWFTISYRVFELIVAAVRQNPAEFPILKHVHYYGAYEVDGQKDLEQLILETERILGSDSEFRTAMGRIHGAAAHSWAAGSRVSFLGEAKFEY